MKTRGEIFTEITNRNALRKESSLPLLDVRAEYEKGLDINDCERFRQICEANAEMQQRVRARICAEMGDPQSFGGIMALNIKVEREFHDYLRSIGVTIPAVAATKYGGDKDKS